ncbi:MAG: sulfatase [Planctomycetales bacterium]|nr:sulfatase [Planctomycetales bacterium]
MRATPFRMIMAGVLLAWTPPPLASLGQDGQARRAPNFIVVLTDDQGYGDLGSFGSQTIRTPHLDRMAQEGTRFTSFYAQTVCGPSRFALLSGAYPARDHTAAGWVLPGDVVTLAEAIQPVGYRTGCVGKWDVSGRKYVEGLVPNDQGFDEYYGTLGANDGGEVTLWRNREQVETTRDMSSLTSRYTAEALDFIERHREQPFLLYLAHSMPHVRIDASAEFKGKSQGDLYGDVIEEIDHSVGQILDRLRSLQLDQSTIVIFYSDNGPWNQLEQQFQQSHGGHLASGSAGPLRGGKGSSWEGGLRVPCLAWGPGQVPAGRVCDQIFCSLDILPSLARLTGAPLASGVAIDGIDQSALLTGQPLSDPTPATGRHVFAYFVMNELQAIRRDRWKLALPGRTQHWPFAIDSPPLLAAQLYDLDNDIGERHDVALDHPDLVTELLQLAEETRLDMQLPSTRP